MLAKSLEKFRENKLSIPAPKRLDIQEKGGEIFYFQQFPYTFFHLTFDRGTCCYAWLQNFTRTVRAFITFITQQITQIEEKLSIYIYFLSFVQLFYF